MKNAILTKKNVKNLAKIFITITIMIGIVCTTTNPLAMEVSKPEVKSGVDVNTTSKASLDMSNLQLGLISIKYTGGSNVKIKMQVSKAGSATYSYDLNNKGDVETFALTEGDGQYTVKVFENTTGTKYAQVYSHTFTATLTNSFYPYLYPNQYVDFTSNSATVAKANELSQGLTSDLEKVTTIYNYVINNFTYDEHLAATVTSGYLPVLDSVLAAKKGICFDYAALMTAMLRSQNIPCKLVVGYAGTVYHAWINVYLEDEGWIEQAIFFDGTSWTLMDPTFASSANSDPGIMGYIGSGSNYNPKFAY